MASTPPIPPITVMMLPAHTAYADWPPPLPQNVGSDIDATVAPTSHFGNGFSPGLAFGLVDRGIRARGTRQTESRIRWFRASMNAIEAALHALYS